MYQLLKKNKKESYKEETANLGLSQCEGTDGKAFQAKDICLSYSLLCSSFLPPDFLTDLPEIHIFSEMLLPLIYG